MSIQELLSIKQTDCPCGKMHINPIDEICIGKGAVQKLPQLIGKYKAKKAFVLSDKNTYRAAGELVCRLLSESGIGYTSFILDKDKPEPDEYSVGSVLLHYDTTCDIVIGVGSGVINDIGKIVSAVAGGKYIIVGTAPSMDGYASATSSVTRDGLKISLPSKSADAIIGDTDILCNAPEKMLVAGLGDMLAKYVSLCEWRIASIVTGEYYCEAIANLVRTALKRCTDNAEELLKRDEKAVSAVFEGLVIGGIAMTYAGLSRPASGVEHYFSHIWDMRGEEFKTPVDLHGIQCGIGTLMAIRLYEKIKQLTPNREKALSYVQSFDYEVWKETLLSYLGKAAKAMIELEEKEQKYNTESHKDRLEVICENWDKILKIIEEELPPSAEVESLLDKINAPKSPSQIGMDEKENAVAFRATKDIRDKYVLSRLAWDLGVLEEML